MLFFDRKEQLDILALNTFTGGVPKYIELLVNAGASTKDGMIEFIARADSPFIEEGRKLLVNGFGKKYWTYFSILQAISEGYSTPAEVKDYLWKKVAFMKYKEKKLKKYQVELGLLSLKDI